LGNFKKGVGMFAQTHTGVVTRWGIHSRNGRRLGRLMVVKTTEGNSQFPPGAEVYVDEMAFRRAGLSAEDPCGRRFEFLPRENLSRPGSFYADLLCPERLGEAVVA